MQRFFLLLSRMLPMILVMGAIFFLSGIPGDRLNLPAIANICEIAHIWGYGLLAVTLFYAVAPWSGHLNPRCLTAVVILVCLLYGISDEYHKSFILDRSAGPVNILLDGLGTIIVCAVRNSRFWRGLSL